MMTSHKMHRNATMLVVFQRRYLKEWDIQRKAPSSQPETTVSFGHIRPYQHGVAGDVEMQMQDTFEIRLWWKNDGTAHLVLYK